MNQELCELSDLFGDAVYSYTREMAIEDGYLVDVSEMAHEAGFRIPVALTRAAWDDCVAWDEGDRRQDVKGRLWDVLWMASLAARRKSGGDEPRRLFSLYRVPMGSQDGLPQRVALAIHIGPGDQGEPVITIMQPDED